MRGRGRGLQQAVFTAAGLASALGAMAWTAAGEGPSLGPACIGIEAVVAAQEAGDLADHVVGGVSHDDFEEVQVRFVEQQRVGCLMRANERQLRAPRARAGQA